VLYGFFYTHIHITHKYTYISLRNVSRSPMIARPIFYAIRTHVKKDDDDDSLQILHPQFMIRDAFVSLSHYAWNYRQYFAFSCLHVSWTRRETIHKSYDRERSICGRGDIESRKEKKGIECVCERSNSFLFSRILFENFDRFLQQNLKSHEAFCKIESKREIYRRNTEKIDSHYPSFRY